MNFHFVWNIVLGILFTACNAIAQDYGLIVINQNKHTGDFQVSVPSNGPNAPPVVIHPKTGFFATGGAAINLTNPPPSNNNTHQNYININFTDLLLIHDKKTHTQIGAAYPIPQLSGVYVTALHLLQKSYFENREVYSKFKLIGFKNPNTQQIYDVVFLVDITLNADQVINKIQELTGENRSKQPLVYINHLNQIDDNGLSLTQSEAQIISDNYDYMFFSNSTKSFVGPSSSGAPVYTQQQNDLLGSIVCLSKVNNTQGSTVIRVVKFENLKWQNSFELKQDIIDSFKPLHCDLYGGRKGGGD